MTNPVDETLAERGQHYGDFKETFAVIQEIKLALQHGKGWDHMPLERREALEMIAVKIGRLVSGDSGHADSWHDIAGYARLVEQGIDVRLTGNPEVNECMMPDETIRALEIKMNPMVHSRVMLTARDMHKKEYSRYECGVKAGDSKCGIFLKELMSQNQFITKIPSEDKLFNEIFRAMEAHGSSAGFISAFGYADNAEQVLMDIEDACRFLGNIDAYKKKMDFAKSWFRSTALHMALIVAAPYLRRFAEWVTLQSLDQERLRVK